MSADFLKLANPPVQHLQPYQPGKPIEELQRELGLTDVIKLASNENPLGMSEVAKQAINSALQEGSRYPDGGAWALKQRLARHLSVVANQLTIGNGSNDVLELIVRAYLQPGDNAVVSQHAFVVYPLAVQAVGADLVQTPALNWGHDLAAMAAAINTKTRLVFIANPNNPTGTWLTQQALSDFLSQVPEQVLVVIDEAYIEYSTQQPFANGLELAQHYPNVIVTRTFSKAYGLASLRVGYSVSQPVVADVLNRLRQPFNVNSLALAAAAAVLDDTDFLQKSCQTNSQGLAQLEAGLRRLSVDFIPSMGNFISIDLKTDAMPVYQALLQLGIIVRPVGGYQMPNHLRVSIGLPGENERFLTALQQVLTVK